MIETTTALVARGREVKEGINSLECDAHKNNQGNFENIWVLQRGTLTMILKTFYGEFQK